MSPSIGRVSVVVTLVTLVIGGLVTTSANGGTPAFSNQTGPCGVASAHDPVYAGSMWAGGAVGDFNNDGHIDVFHPSGGTLPDRLFINLGNGEFVERAAVWGVGQRHRGTGAAVGDYNGDGWQDIFVSSLGPATHNEPGHHRLYRNNGNGTFTNVAAAAGVNLTATRAAEACSAAFGDYDLDGDLDLAVAGYGSSSGGVPEGSIDGNRLFRNDGDGTFTDVTQTAGLTTLVGINGFLPRFVDLDGDRYPEIIWIGDFSTSRFYANNGDGTFTDRTEASGTALGLTEMGCAVADLNEDGAFDFYTTTVFDNKLYLNDGTATFLEVAESAGVEYSGFGWGSVAIDMDHDTRIDLVATSQSQRQYLFRNVTAPGGQLAFEEVALDVGLDTPVSGRGLANFDYDGDGDQDLIFFPSNQPIEIFRNDLTGDDIHWLRVRLERGARGDIAPNGIGSVIRARFGARTLTGRIDGGSNYLSQSEMAAHFGLGAADHLDEVTIVWPSGDITMLTNVPADRTITVWPGGKPGDVDRNGVVDSVDLAAVITAWGPCPPGESCPADIDDDELVDFRDVLEVLAHWD